MSSIKLRSEAISGIKKALASVSEGDIESMIQEIKLAKRLYFTGAGRSFLMIKSFGMALMQIGYNVYATGDISTPSLTKGDLLIAASSSGETQSVLLFLQQAQAMGARVALITSNPNSSMARASNLVIKMNNGVEADSTFKWQTGSFFELAVAPLGDCIVEALATQVGASSETISLNHANLE